VSEEFGLKAPEFQQSCLSPTLLQHTRALRVIKTNNRV
jgi:hypothetical protein